MVHLPFSADDQRYHVRPDPARNFVHYLANKPLAATATLSTDTGIRVNSTLWDAPRGGHHVEGKLIFPATYEGKSILEGATKLTLTIVDVDASTRVFEWELK
jgi:hypothetical protein